MSIHQCVSSINQSNVFHPPGIFLKQHVSSTRNLLNRGGASKGSHVLPLCSSVEICGRSVALFDMPNSNRFDILSISIFSEISLSISISIFSKISLSISISISIFSKTPYRYRYQYRYIPEQPYRYRYRYRYFPE